MRAIKFINEKTKTKAIHHDLVLELIKEFAFEAWKMGEENGRHRLSSNGNLDLIGSRIDYEAWLNGKTF